MLEGLMQCKADWDAFRKRAGKAQCYVRMTDTFFSGWGLAEGKRNILYLAVMDSDDAMKLAGWIRNHRKEMKRVDWGYFGDKPPRCVYDSTALVQGRIFGFWLEAAGCSLIEEEGDE